GGSLQPETDLELAKKEKSDPAVVVPRQRGHNALLANFAPIIFVEQVPDTGEDPSSAVPEFHFCSEIPNIVTGDEAFERIAVIAKFVVHDGAEKRELEDILVAIDRAGLNLVIWSVRRRFVIVRSRGKLGVQQSDVAV